MTDQPPFINLRHRGRDGACRRARCSTARSTVERALGRDRAREQRWGPRPIDIDLIAYDDVAVDEPGLTLPHPRLFERAFVLVPLAEIVPDRVIAGRRSRDALARVDAGGIETPAEAVHGPCIAYHWPARPVAWHLRR